MKHAVLLLTLVFTYSLTVSAQEAQRLDAEAARAALSVRPPRNPVKSSAPVVKRTYERRAGKGLGLETGAPQDVEVIHRSDGSTEEHPFVSLPILFTVNTDSLLDSTSRMNADQMAAILAELVRRENARFTIQGHTSAEGDAQPNQNLSDQRAARIHALLIGKGVPATSLTPMGLGESCASAAPTAPESQLQLDRRVLIVRMK
ncbi:MAG: OmpA family protein [Verrucomicrobiota bacterium]